MDKLKLNDVQQIFADLKTMALDNRDELIELDSIMGDSDLGLTMVAAFTAAEQYAAEYKDADLGNLFMRAGMTISKAAPSTMGTLVATGFMRGGKALKGVEQLELSHMSNFWQAFTAGLMERGKAKPGDKTIIDALDPAANALADAAKTGASIGEAFTKAYEAALEGVEATKTMIAQHGRAAFHGEKSRSVQDAGATVGSMIVKVFSDIANGKKRK